MYKPRKKFDGEWYYFSQDGPKAICQKTAKSLREMGYKARVVRWNLSYRPAKADIFLIYTKPSTGSPPPRR